MGAKNLGLAASSEAERATNALAQTAHDALVATETAAIADVAVKAPLKIAADAAVVTAGAVDAKVAAVDLFATNDGEKAAAIRDGMNAGLPRVANGMDGQAILARAAASNLSNAGEKSAALVKVTALDEAITAFKGSTTKNTALDTYGTVTTAMATVKAATVTASGGGSTMSGIAHVAALTSAYAHVKVIAPAYSDVKPAAVTAAAAASTALVNSEAAAATATAAKNAS